MEAIGTATAEAEPATCPVTGGGVMTLQGDESRLDPGIRNRPFPFYRGLRKQRPVYHDAALNMWLISRYDDAVTVLRDNENFSLEQGHTEAYGNGFGDELEEIMRREAGGFYPAFPLDPPEHTRVRRLLEKAFTAHRVKSLEPRIRQIVIDLIDPLADRGHADGIKDIGVPMTARIICEQLGFDFADVGVDRISRWTTAELDQMGRMQSREQMLSNARELVDMQNYIIPQIRRREAEPREDMVSDVVHARADDGSDQTLSFGEQVACVKGLLIAGNDTTAAALANLMLVLATQPEVGRQLHAAADDDRMLARFVEEFLRVNPPVHGLFRSTRNAVEVGGTTIPAHAQVCILYASANDDEKQFPCPRQIDLSRSNLTSHLTFSTGIHRCIGIALAKMEIKVAAREIIKRLDNFQLAMPVEDITYLPTLATQTLTRLPVTFTRRAA